MTIELPPTDPPEAILRKNFHRIVVRQKIISFDDAAIACKTASHPRPALPRAWGHSTGPLHSRNPDRAYLLVTVYPTQCPCPAWDAGGAGGRATDGAFPDVSARARTQGVMANKQGQKPGIQRGNRQRFPYEPRVVGGKLMMPAELQTIHRYVLETPVLENVTDEIRAVVKTVWPELMSKLPPKA